MPEYERAALFEHRFWLQILGDHSRFIHSSLSPEEKKEIQKALKFIEIFDELLEKARESLSENEISILTSQAYKHTMELKAFKLYLLKRHLVGEIKVHLPPTFFNHMLNELEEYQAILCSLMQGGPPYAHPVHHHLLWLLDGSGHASSIAGSLDDVEKKLIKASRSYAQEFEDLYLKAVEMRGYLRTGEMKFPSLERLNKEANAKMLEFKDFLNEIRELVLEKKVLGTIMPIVPDHMDREECYYLTKLSSVSEIPRPDCDPVRPRLET